MDYLETLLRFRNDMHRDILQEATVKTFSQHEGNNAELTLRIPFGMDKEDLYIIGVDCSTGDIISENVNGIRNTVRYQHLSIEELAMLHRTIVDAKDYKINQLV